jgi:excisionase family DNA binding protein
MGSRLNKSQQRSVEADRMSALTVRVPEACRMTGIGRSKLYELIKDGQLKTIKVGEITSMSVSELKVFLGVDRT